MEDAVWEGVDRLVDRAPSLADLRAHRLHLFAAARWRDAGLAISSRLLLEEASYMRRTATASGVLSAIRAACDGPLMVLKGPAVSRLYPDPTRRPFSDIDILAEDPEGAQRALLEAGFERHYAHPDAYYDGLHHLRPLKARLGPVVEIHRRPNWVTFADPPGTSELFAEATEAAAGVAGFVAPPPAQQALIVAAGAWAERPLRRIIDLVDVELLAAAAGRSEIERIASYWGLARVWRSTIEAADALILGRAQPSSLRTWGRAAAEVRSQTIIEDHVSRWMSPFWALPPARAAIASGTALLNDVRPVPDESWTSKLGRAREALAHPTRRVPEHKRKLGPEGVRPRFKRDLVR
jgi:hypothetical protein